MALIIRFILLAMVVLAPLRAVATESEGFLIPGVDFASLELKEGAWCRYLVADEALGQIDSSEIYIGVPSSEMTADGEAFWVEIETRPLGASSEETQLLKLLVLEKITTFGPGDSLGEYVVKLYNRKGTHPPQLEDPKRFKEFSLVIPTTDSSWVTTHSVPTGTAVGEFTCTKKERYVNDDKEVMTGKIRLIKKARDHFTVWFCNEVPVFRLARCEISRTRNTETVPKIRGIPTSGRKDSRTTAELIGYGLDAKPILAVDQIGP